MHAVGSGGSVYGSCLPPPRVRAERVGHERRVVGQLSWTIDLLGGGFRIHVAPSRRTSFWRSPLPAAVVTAETTGECVKARETPSSQLSSAVTSRSGRGTSASSASMA